LSGLSIFFYFCPDSKILSVHTEIDDKSLVSLIRNDDLGAYEALYHRYKRKLYYFALGYLKNGQEAEDIVQNVFVSLWEHRSSLDENQSLKSYIFRSAVNAIYNLMKRKSIQNRFIDSELHSADFSFNQTSHDVYFNDLISNIDSIVLTLSPQQQQIFHLSRRQGMSHAEIAEKLDISERTVENQIYRTLKAIKEKLKPEMFFLLCLYFF
jgi:RNA polymerase sigma-70 factor, ECF subfamily